MPVAPRIALALLLVGKISASAQFASEQAVALDCALPSTVPAASSSQVYKPNASRKTSEDSMTITVDKDGSWHWDGGKDGAQEFDEKAMTEALKRYDELGEHCYAQRNPAIGEDTLTEYINLAWDSMLKFKGERSTWTTWDRQIWDEIFITQYIRSIAKDWYTWLLEHTSGNAKSRLREIAELDKGKAFEFRSRPAHNSLVNRLWR